MKIQSPQELEAAPESAIQAGHFASLDDAFAESVRLLLCKFHLPSLPEVPLAKTFDPILEFHRLAGVGRGFAR
ncbi:hypothetical protein [Singulisphaera sp. PoT]|uniref:hypothetical protein n=1 Tax=Singulisphaera sp. PoT TaxID=3411797 RepID=UPI003BF4C15E